MGKYDLLTEFVDNLTDDELFELWSEFASDGKLNYIEHIDSIDELFTPSQILSLDISDFDIYDTYFVDDGVNSLISYGTCREVIDDGFVGDLDDLIDCIDDDYDGYVDGLRDLLDSEEYRNAV